MVSLTPVAALARSTTNTIATTSNGVIGSGAEMISKGMDYERWCYRGHGRTAPALPPLPDLHTAYIHRVLSNGYS